MGNHDVWLEGTQLIAAANARARDRNAEAAATEDDLLASTIEEQQDGGLRPLDFEGCQVFAEPRDQTQETQETNVGLATLHQPYGKNDADDTVLQRTLHRASHRSPT